MNRLWAKHLPQMEERVATLQNAAEHLSRGILTEKEQRRAGADAHKLAGVLGTFGLNDGTALAREAEGIYEGVLDSNPDTVLRLSLIAERLKALVMTRSQAS
jgi:HPt (histidine-containing phosphotransfer) domain-containing protein